MTAIPQQSIDFLKSSAPFDLLDVEDLVLLARQITVAYFDMHNSESLLKDKSANLFLISSGQFSVKDSDQPEKHLSEGDYFGCDNVLNDLTYPIKIQVASPGLVYCIPCKAFIHCMAQNPKIEDFFRRYTSEQLHTDPIGDSKSMWLYKPLSELIEGEVVSAEVSTSILDSVRRMSSNSVSSLLITESDKLVGILTDRDIRNRIVASQVDLAQPVTAVMTRNPASVAQNRTLFDALCVMTESNIHHLPIVDKHTGAPLGMLTASDMIRYQRGNVLLLIDELTKAKSLYELTRLSWQLPHYFAKHAKRLGDFDVAGKVLSQATDIMTRKLLNFHHQQFGNPPFDYCWLVYGSQAREDQTMGSDQDNSLLLARQPDEQESAYFAQMAEYVCQGLGKCGIKLCDGNIMASNPNLRVSLEQAIADTRKWVNQPTIEAILHFNIFLDVRAVAGNTELFNQLQQARQELLKQPIFLAALARYAGQANVPLSVFRKFVYDKSASQGDCIDLKVNAVAIINNLVRIYALAEGLKVPSTPGRLEVLQSSKVITKADAQNMRDIWLFLNRLRWRHQLENNVTNNKIIVSQLSSIQKHQLKASFKTIQRAQQAVTLKFSGGMG